MTLCLEDSVGWTDEWMFVWRIALEYRIPRLCGAEKITKEKHALGNIEHGNV